jgi:hypothetical protein
MAAYFQLRRKGEPDSEPIDLNALDEEICKRYGETPHERRYYLGWYDSIGFRLALGDSWDAIRAGLQPEEKDDDAYRDVLSRLREIATWLEEQFEVRAWRR